MRKIHILITILSIANTVQCLHLDVYYESLCPDCTGFITEQLYPTWNTLQGNFSLSLYPFGNARETRLSNGTFAYHCQHGEIECRGNFLEICIIKKARFDAQIYLPILTCIEHSVRNGLPVEKSAKSCVNFFRPEEKYYKWITHCASVSYFCRF